MAISYTTLDQGAGSGNAATSNSISPPANKPIYAFIGASRFSATVGTISLTGNGLTWVEDPSAGVVFSGGQVRGSFFRALGASPSSGTVSISVSGILGNGIVWAIWYTDGADTSGSDASGSIVQTVTGSTAGDDPNTFNVTLPSSITGNDSTLGLFCNDNSSATNTPSSGYTELFDQASGGSGSVGIAVHYKVPGTTTPGTTVSAAFADIGGIGIEIKEASGGTSLSPTSGAQIYGGLTPSLNLSLVLTSGSILYTGNTPTNTLQLQPTSGAQIYGGNTPSLSTLLQPTVGSIVYTGNVPSLINAVLLQPTTGDITYTGNTPDLSLSLAIQSGSIMYAGNIPDIPGSRVLHYTRRHGRCYYS